MTIETTHNPDLEIVKKVVYDKCGFALTKLKMNSESVEYGACSFELNGQIVAYRVSKITPAKAGQFVTIWKRNQLGLTEPFDLSDHIDFVVITSRRGDQLGQFVFPKTVLVEKGIMSRNGKVGKRGIRVYPSWDTTTNKQAERVQRWQIEYFVEIKGDNTTDLGLVRKLFGHTNTIETDVCYAK